MMKNCFFKSLMLSSLLFVIGCAEQGAEKAVKEIRALYFSQIELQEVPSRQHKVVFIDQEKLDEQLTILSKIKKDMEEIAEKYPKAKVVSSWLTDRKLAKYYFNKEKVDRTIDMLTHEKKLFRIRDRILALDGTNPEQGIFNFDFGETVTSSCSASGRVGTSPRSSLLFYFEPKLETEALKPFFLKFDRLIDSMVLSRELQEKAIKELPRDDLPTILGKREKEVSPADVYRQMLKRFVTGSTFPSGVFETKSGGIKDEFSQQLNKVLASCSSNEAEFVERVGTWLPKDSKFLLEVVGNKKDQVPVYVTLYGTSSNYGISSKHRQSYLFDPLVENLKKKYGDPLFSSWDLDEQENFWITDDGRLIVAQWAQTPFDPKSTYTEMGTRLTYIYLPVFIKNFQSWLDTYNNELSDFIETRSDNIKDMQKNRDQSLQSKL